MNWAALAAAASIVSVLAVIVGGAFVYGRLTQQVVDNRDKTSDHAATLEKHAEKLEDHGEKIGRLQEWKNGFNAAARVSGSKEVS